jgi:hypothetical protein
MLDLEFSTEIKSKLLPIAMHSEVTIELVGLLAHCRITQTFTNTTNELVEAIHTIPVPVESTLNGVLRFARMTRPGWVRFMHVVKRTPDMNNG